MNKNKILKGLVCALSPLALISCGGNSAAYSVKIKLTKVSDDGMKKLADTDSIKKETEKSQNCFKVSVEENTGKEKTSEEKLVCNDNILNYFLTLVGEIDSVTVEGIKANSTEFKFTYSAAKEETYKEVVKKFNATTKYEEKK